MGDTPLQVYGEDFRGCPFATTLLLDWKQVLSCIKWAPPNPRANSFLQEIIYWSAVFDNPFACQELVKA